MSGRISNILSTVSITLAVESLVITSSTEGCWLYQPADSLLRTPGSIEATAERRTTAPLARPATAGGGPAPVGRRGATPLPGARASPPAPPRPPARAQSATAGRRTPTP